MILFVEDEAISRYAIAQILRSHGHEVMEAKDGIEALALLDEYPLQRGHERQRYLAIVLTQLVGLAQAGVERS